MELRSDQPGLPRRARCAARAPRRDRGRGPAVAGSVGGHLRIDHLPAALAAIHGPGWRDPGPDALRDILGRQWNLPDLELFDFQRMQSVARALDAAYVDLPHFCMTRGPARESDPRLTLDSALIIAGSKVPGDDVFVAADYRLGEAVSVRIFDWDSEVPNRWRHVRPFPELAAEIARRASPRDG